ncbi:MAG: hypothetical protein KC776_16475 [Myxococcales bacterium]|nr:hypothetical protein [Myxococcales bacterium]MCB9582139.1 hypothetical protein [Polyangiaceae bacterium]
MLPKKSKTRERRGQIVPTELPVFSELERRGLVVVMGERGGSAPNQQKKRKTKPQR